MIPGVEWGDGTTTGWTRDYAPGLTVRFYHTWNKQGNYTIEGFAKPSILTFLEIPDLLIRADKKITFSSENIFGRTYPLPHAFQFSLVYVSFLNSVISEWVERQKQVC